MSDFLGSLVDRSQGTGPTLRPRFPSRFESVRAPAAFAGESFDPESGLRDETPFAGSAPNPATQPVASPVASVAAPVMENHRAPFAVPAIPALDRIAVEPSQALPSDFPNDQDRSGRFTAVTESSFDPRSDRWLGRRLDDLSHQLRQLRGTPSESRDVPPAPFALPTETPSRQLPNNAAPETVAFQPLTVRETRAADEANPAPTLTVAKPALPSLTGAMQPSRIEPRDELLAMIEAQRRQSVREKDAVVENDLAPTLAPANPTPPSIGSLAPQPRRESRDELLALFAASQMQPVPKIVPEDLPAISKHTAPPQPTINVTIGRVEVKATREAAPAARPARPQAGPAVMSLQDYLQRRAAGGIS